MSKSNYFNHHKKGGQGWQENLIAGQDQSVETALLSDWRKLFFPIFMIISLAVILTRLIFLQIIDGGHLRALADSNRIQIKVIHAPRGVIYDRNGKILAQNEPGFRLLEPGSPALFSYLTRDQALKMEVEGDARYKTLEIDSIRSYPYSQSLSHITGFVNEILPEELKDPAYKNYHLGDRVGRGGVEQVYEKVLRGVDGGEAIEVDAQGRNSRTLRKIDSNPGQNLYLTIDADLQNLAYQKLQEGILKSHSCCGALVAQDPKSGQILALVSYPAYNPADLKSFLSSANSPLLNRVIAGTYPPGSTFKIASALAGLASGKVTSKTQFVDNGFITLGPYKFANWYYSEYGKTEGALDLVKAIARSNDIYFYYLGQTIGEKTLGDFSKQLGLGKSLGIDLPGEAVGLIPDEAWKQKNYHQIWFPGDTLHMAIGQGFVLTTPLQINNLISQIAANGKQYPPHLALKITSPGGATIQEFKFQGYKSIFKEADLALVKKGLELVPKDGGTAWPFFNFPIPTAGKTGTAEFGEAKKTHAWYTSFAPVDDPKIAVTVLIEGGGEGSTVAAPVAKEIYRWYFSPDKKNLIKDIAPISTDSARTLGE